MDRLKIGWAKREISLDEPVNLFGQMFMRISESVMDPCYVTALCMDGGCDGDTIIFCSCDIEAMRCDFIDMTKKAVQKICPELPLEAIIINATHTHTGGDVTDSPTHTPDGEPFYDGKRYRTFVTQKCAEAICEAWQNRREGGMSYGYGFAVAGHSRRTIYSEDKFIYSGGMAPNGHGVMNGSTSDPTFSHYEAGSDHMMNLLFTYDENDKLTGILVNVPCPSQVGDMLFEMSGDFWSNVRDLMAEKFGEDVYLLPQCAAAGDLVPGIYHYRDAEKRRLGLKYDLPFETKEEIRRSRILGRRAEIAERIFQGMCEVCDWAWKDIQTNVKVGHLCRTLELDRRMITEEEKQWCEDNLVILKQDVAQIEASDLSEVDKRTKLTEKLSYIRRNTEILQRFETQMEQKTVPTIVHAVQIGDIAFCTNRFEMFMDYMHRIQGRSPFLQTFVVQLCGDEGADYLATERAVKNRGYSASLFENPVSYIGGNQLVEATLEMLTELKTRE